jgi:hypothetical protein
MAIRINYSMAEKVAHCPRRYELDLAAPIERTTSPALYVGSTFHLVQKSYFEARMLGIKFSLDNVLELFFQYWDNETGAEGQAIDWKKENPDEHRELCKEMVKAYFPYAEQIVPVMVETKLTKDIPELDVTVSGIIDLITSFAVPIDYKTSSTFPYQTDIDRSMQPTFYHLLCGGFRIFEYHYIMKEKLPVVRIFPTKRNAGDVNFLTNSLIPAVVKHVQSGVYPPYGIFNGQCHWCTYRGFCGTL